jgi:hypothetical protein
VRRHSIVTRTAAASVETSSAAVAAPFDAIWAPRRR